MTEARAPIIDHMAALADPTRCRMLRLLDGQDLTVSELCAVLQLPQSTVSRHLKTLADEGWVASQRNGTSRLYAMPPDELDPGARRLWALIREQVSHGLAADQDARRLKSVLTSRRTKSQEFFSTGAGQWDRLRERLFGGTFHLHAALGLLDHTHVVGDLGCGTGVVTEAIAPHVERVIAIDGSPEMLRAARRRVGDVANVELRRGELEALPIDDGQLDAALIVLVLHHVPEPARALAEAARAIRRGGRLVITDMLPHDRQEYQQQMGHVWLGFSTKQMSKYLVAAGFDRIRIQPLPMDAAAKGPALFVATASRA